LQISNRAALEYETFLIRREMAEMLDKEERANELREEDDRDEQERKKARRRETIGFFVISARAFAWWYTGAVPFASLRHTAG
jgi:hypothetical protein